MHKKRSIDIITVTRGCSTHKYPGSPVCYLNADIILMSDFTRALACIDQDRFLVIGQRWDVDMATNVDFSQPTWEQALRDVVESHGTLSLPQAMDYFIFPTGTMTDMPEFAVGRPWWDNWVVHKARCAGTPVIDATPAILAVHQNHHYRHVKHSTGPKWEGPEADASFELASDMPVRYGVHDATHVIRDNRVRRTTFPPYIDEKINKHKYLEPRSKRLEPLQRRVFWRIYHRRSSLPVRLWHYLAYHLTS